MNTVTRKEFLAAIDSALMANREDIPFEAWIYLRKVGVTATEFEVGRYAKCPLGLAGIAPDDGEWTAPFAFAFDDAITSLGHDALEFDFRVEG